MATHWDQPEWHGTLWLQCSPRPIVAQILSAKGVGCCLPWPQSTEYWQDCNLLPRSLDDGQQHALARIFNQFSSLTQFPDKKVLKTIKTAKQSKTNLCWHTFLHYSSLIRNWKEDSRQRSSVQFQIQIRSEYWRAEMGHLMKYTLHFFLLRCRKITSKHPSILYSHFCHWICSFNSKD